MTNVKFKDGTTGTVIQVLSRGHGDIRAPYHLQGALVVKMDKPCIGYLTVLPEGMDPMYSNEVRRDQVTIIY